MPLKNWCSIHERWSKSSLKNSIRFCGIFPSLKQIFIAYRSSKVSDCIFEIYQLCQSGFSRVYSNCCCSSSFEPEIIKIDQSPNKMYSNDILTNLNACTKESQKTYWMHQVFQTSHFSISTQFKHQIVLFDSYSIQSCAPTLGQSRLWSDCNEGVFRIP